MNWRALVRIDQEPHSGPLAGRSSAYWSKGGVPVLVDPTRNEAQAANFEAPRPGMVCVDQKTDEVFVADAEGDLVPLGWLLSDVDRRSVAKQLDGAVARLEVAVSEINKRENGA